MILLPSVHKCEFRQIKDNNFVAERTRYLDGLELQRRSSCERIGIP